MRRKKGKSRIMLLFFIMAVSAIAWFAYNHYILNKAKLKDRSYVFIYLERKDGFEDLISKLDAEQVVEDLEAFQWLAKKMKLDENIHPGKYRITNGMNARQIINLIKYNQQEKIKLTFNSQIHNLDEFVEYTDSKLELSEEEIEAWLVDEKKLDNYFGLHPGNAFGLVVPGICEVSWAIEPGDFFALLRDRFQKVWNENRRKKVRALGYSVPEILTMASIVQCESGIASEQAKIAGVYFNRLEEGMPLQADPTLKFANGNYDAQRLLNEDKEINSPYNTYRFKGLPPGPIALVSTQAIDATLNFSRHNYLFFCAKPGLNGYSDFSVNYEQHRKFATAYQKALDEKGINR